MSTRRYAACIGLSLVLAASAWADSGVNDTLTSRTFSINATITQGCWMGSSTADVTSYGSINFGQVSTLPSNVNVTSAVGSGSIQLLCTPGTAVAIAINTGANSSNISTGRFLKNGAETLRYQLYQDNGTTIWGNGTNGTTALSVTIPAGAGVQTYPVYARLFAVTPMPSAGIYTDTVTVTITY